ncbi:MAG: mechanosensitive ion channel family protein [Candidatus Rifleibacteriota bacterium]
MDKLDWQLISNKAYELGTAWSIKLLGALAILIIGSIVIKFLTGMIRKVMERSNIDQTITHFLHSIVKISLQIVLWLMVLGNLGIKTTSFIAILGSAGIAVGLALQGSLSNIGAGVLLISLRPFQVGQYISGGGESGTVDSIGIFYTTLITPDNKKIIVPNSKVASDSITNYSAMERRRVDFKFGISYDDDIKLAKNILNQIVENDERILKDPAPQVVVVELGDSSVNFAVRAWAKASDYWSLYFDMLERVKITFDEKGITIPFPQRDIHMYQTEEKAA